MKIDAIQLKEIIVSAAKEELLPRFSRVVRSHKADGSVITEADIAMQQRIARQLQEAWPDTVFLGEEMTVEEQAHIFGSDKPIWCLDPLDGTSNFASGIPYFSVSLALLQNSKVVLGVVYDPIREEFFSASENEPACMNGFPISLSNTGLELTKSTALIDFKRLDPILATRLVTDLPYSSQRSFGSVALDWCWLALGRGHIYLHGRSNIWDYAAGNYIFHAAGGNSTSLSGETIFVNSLEPRSSVAAVDEHLFMQWIHYLDIVIKNGSSGKFVGDSS